MDSYRKEWAEHPRDQAGYLSIIFYTWILKIFGRDRKLQLNLDNIWGPPSSSRSDKLGDRLEKTWMDHLARKRKKSQDPSFGCCLIVTFWREIVWMALLNLVVSLADVLFRPYLLGKLITAFSKDVDAGETSIIAVELMLLNFVSGAISSHYLNLTAVLGMDMRAAVVSVVFRKSLKLSKTALNDVSPGQIVNLVSNDVSRFEIVTVSSCFLWTGPMQALIVAYFLYQDVGVFGFAGMAVIGAIAILQTYTARLTSTFRRKIAKETDRRIRLTDEILAGILVIKLYAWEKPFAFLLEKARSAELKYVLRSNLVRGLYMAFNMSTTKMALFLTLSASVLNGINLSTAEVFVIASYYVALNHTMTSVFVRGVQEMSECRVSMRRIQGFLLRNEIDNLLPVAPKITVKEESVEEETPLNSEIVENLEKRDEESPTKEKIVASQEKNGVDQTSKLDLAVVVQNVKASWVEGRMVPTLSNLTFSVRRHQLIALIGSVGSGKSSLLHLLLRELKEDLGKVFVNGSVSYASQEPWIFAGTVRDNILLGRSYNRARYKKVITAACLTRDMDLFPRGDKTMVGERGASLSGGQRARISLARAIYREADIYLLDDPLSAVDAHVSKDMFQFCFKGFLKNKTVILVTHQLQFLDQVDKIIFLQMGQIKDIGSFEDLMKRGHDFTKIVEESQALAVEPVSVSPPSGGHRSRSQTLSEHEQESAMGSAVSLQRSDYGNEGCEEEAEPLQETSAPYKGNIFIDYLKAGSAFVTFGIFVLFLAIAQFLASFCDYWVSVWAKTFDLKSQVSSTQNSTNILSSTNNDSSLIPEETLSNLTTTLEDVVSNITSSSNGTASFLSDAWSNQEWTDNFFVTVYGAAVFLLFSSCLIRGLIYVWYSFKCSRGLHSLMVKSALHTDLSYFNDNPSGSILNKFSKDLGTTDEMLPKAILDSSQTLALAAGGIINTLIVNPYLLVPLGVFVVASLMIRKYYMRTSTNLKRIENISRGPVYTHLNTCLQGLTTIRAQNAQQYLKAAFDFHQDLNTACLFSYVSAQSGYTYALDLASVSYVTVVVFSCILAKGGISGADLGLATTQSMMMTGMLQWGTRQSSEVVNMMTSVERLATFTKLPPEDPNEAEKKPAPNDWPPKGAIELDNVSLRYKKDSPLALKNVSLVIRPGEKLGIVGRTGAGKSTLTSVLFRLASVEGKCIIDGIDTSTLILQSLRSSLAIIPQNPVLFSGNLRRNLDPFELQQDHELWSALEDIDLTEIAKDGQGLDARISDCGNNLSVGQRQLVCLARAVLKKRNIIVLDEATASVDPETDAQIQRTIRKKFANCTVLTIAHRLNTIMDSDRILVMDAGQAVELDTPHNLLQNEKGYFYSLVQETGSQMATRLTHQALENHLQNEQRTSDS